MATDVRPHPARGISITSGLLVVCLIGLVEEIRSVDDYDYGGPSGWWWVALLVLAVVLITKVAGAREALAERRRQLETSAEREADLAWRADLGPQHPTLQLLRSAPPQLPRSHQKVVGIGTACAAAGELAYDHDFALDLDLDDLLDPFVAAGKLALWAGGSVMSAYDSLPHRQKAIAAECVQVLEEQRELAAEKAAARPDFRRHVRALLKNYEQEAAATERWQPLLPHRRRAREHRLDNLRRRQRLAKAATRL